MTILDSHLRPLYTTEISVPLLFGICRNLSTYSIDCPYCRVVLFNFEVTRYQHRSPWTNQCLLLRSRDSTKKSQTLIIVYSSFRVKVVILASIWVNFIVFQKQRILGQLDRSINDPLLINLFSSRYSWKKDFVSKFVLLYVSLWIMKVLYIVYFTILVGKSRLPQPVEFYRT